MSIYCGSNYGFQAMIDLPARCCVTHCPVCLTLANPSDRHIKFTEVCGIPSGELILKDSSGRRPVLQEGNHPFWPLFSAPFSKDPLQTRDFRIGPGERRSWTLDLALYFKLASGLWILKFVVRGNVTSPERWAQYEEEYYNNDGRTSFTFDYDWFGVTDYPLIIDDAP